jgi:predicted kinase
MHQPALLIVTGHPATGKTTLARKLAAALALPLVSKDMLKESLFDSLGWSDRDWSMRVGVAAIALLYRVAEATLAAGMPLVVESNFRPDFDTPRMLELRGRCPFRPVQLRCIASGEVMAERYVQRVVRGERHPGHCETLAETKVAALRALGQIEPLGLGGPLLTVDTTDLAALDMASVLRWVRARAAAPGPAPRPPKGASDERR